MNVYSVSNYPYFYSINFETYKVCLNDEKSDIIPTKIAFLHLKGKQNTKLMSTMNCEKESLLTQTVLVKKNHLKF